MKYTHIAALMLVAGSTVAFLPACSQERTTASDSSRGYYDSAGNWHSGNAGRGSYDRDGVYRNNDSRSYSQRDSTGYYDSNGVWQSSSATTSVATATPSGGYYDSSGTWRPSTVNQGSTGYYDSNGVWRNGTTASADNRPDPHATDRGTPAGQAGSVTYTQGTAAPVGLENRLDPHSTFRGPPAGGEPSAAAGATADSGRNTGYYDSNGVWQSGKGDARVTDSRSADNRASGYYDSNGVWQSGATTSDRPDPHATFRGPPAGGDAMAQNRSAAGYYDSNGVWHSAQKDSATAVASNREGSYDSNGVWQPGRRDTRVTTGGGWYDEKGVWRSDAQASMRTDNRPDAHATFRGPPAGGGAVTDTPMSSDGVRVVDGNPNVSTGYYDSNGVWHSVGPAGVVNIPIGTSTSRVYGPAIVQTNRSWQDRSGYAASDTGYYDSNGVWQTRTRDDRSYAQVNTNRNGYQQPKDAMDRNGYAAENRGNALAVNWGGKPGEQVRMMTGKYGQPDEVTDSCVAWKDKGGFACIKVFKEEVDHKWPVAHTDFLEHAVAYKVPVDKVGELAKFDGSVYVDVTKGCLAAKCDKESHNLLALNLANDICTGKKTATEARDYFARAIADEMAGKSDPYLERLAFTPASAGTAGNPGAKHEKGSVNESMKDAEQTKAEREAAERDAKNRANDADRDRMNQDQNR